MKVILWNPGREKEILENLLKVLIESNTLTKEQVKSIPYIWIEEPPTESGAPVDTEKES